MVVVDDEKILQAQILGLKWTTEVTELVRMTIYLSRILVYQSACSLPSSSYL
jgi:hypothetical protein